MEGKRIQQVGYSSNEQLKECIQTTYNYIYRLKGTEEKRGQMKGTGISHDFHCKMKSFSLKMIRMEDIYTEIPQTKQSI